MTENESFLSKLTPENPYYIAVMALTEYTIGNARMEVISKADENIRFGLALKLIRTAKGLTQNQVADLVGVDNSYISRIENGDYPPPSRKVVLKLTDIFEFENRTDRLYFVLFAGCGSWEDIEGTEFEESYKKMFEEVEKKWFQSSE